MNAISHKNNRSYEYDNKSDNFAWHNKILTNPLWFIQNLMLTKWIKHTKIYIELEKLGESDRPYSTERVKPR